ncbi:hypothetical protein AUEXF2481DRAFT_31236 [Aureobasidium subglaciale EXF-2481]|uniref:NAD(P)-binding protein n=1 Tax=Aureobasidium subglaciale (strain EXF-2481) TaxID=1043005 RepID=A0A074Z3U1_AURSE|nr:uncharacterized protein AUEXF2481DRAFT_31236 [Aureobasidium subglaciale EXF-2481]KEQ93671.1 hypothetical protein AUEXF2481DRAFT_31236 [Aureobasidium subglaciale EXF-2481]
MSILAQKTVTLVTGGNGGIGFALVAALLTNPSNHVLLGSRSIEKGQKAIADLEFLKPLGTVELLQVDVSSEESINAAAKQVKSKHGKLDALVNNAAIAIPPGSLAEQMAICFQTNATGPLLMVEAFTPMLLKSDQTPRIINVSTGQGSITKRLDPTAPGYKIKGIQYRASKTALNMVTASQVAELGEQGVKVFAYDPGFTQSSLGPHNKAEFGAKPASEAAAPIIKVLNGERDSEHACFLHATGQFPW